MTNDEVRCSLQLCATVCLVLVALVASNSFAQIGGTAGAYSRMGFGARGMAMGNALTAVTSGDAVSYYNPATIPFAEYRHASASFGILAFDRRLNFLSFTQPLGGKPDSLTKKKPLNRAGISVGIINSGVTNIDGRDSDGEPTGLLQTSENQAFLGFGTQFKNGLAIGVNVKYLYHHLYTDINSNTFGVDVGLLFPLNDKMTIGASVKDIVSKYTWNTSAIYGENGTRLDDKFPQIYTIGASYKLPDDLGVVALDVEFSNRSTLILRCGAEVPLIAEVTVRAGVDRIDLKEKGNGIRPSFGFTARKSFDELTPAINYAFVVEPFASSGMHMISVSAIF